ncbi:hypothetical protein pb186bvf_002511 [Paramecium bursaria]
MSQTPVILVLVTNKSGRLLEHSQFFKIFSVFGAIQKILIFERKIIWKVFVEYDTPQSAKKALTLDGTLFENTLKMRVHLSQRESLTFQSNNNCGVDYSALASKQQFVTSLKDDSIQFNSQLEQSLNSMTSLMQSIQPQTTDIQTQLQVLNQVKEYRNQAQQLTVLYQQQLRNYLSVLHREGKKTQQLEKSNQPTPSPSPYQQSTIDSISLKQIREQNEETSSDEEFKYSDRDEDVEQLKEEETDDNYDDLFCNQSYNSPCLDLNSPMPASIKSYVIVKHPNTNLRVIYNLFSTFVKIEQLMQSQSGAVIQLAQPEDALYMRDLLHAKLLLGYPLNVTLQMFPPEDAAPVCLPQQERIYFHQHPSNSLFVNGINGSTRDQVIKFFNCIIPIQNLKFLNQNQCKVMYGDISQSLTAIGHLQDAKLNGKSVQLSFTAF